jgi:hypothetical protein
MVIEGADSPQGERLVGLVKDFEDDARRRAHSLMREGSRSNKADLGLSIFVPIVVAVAAGLTSAGLDTAGSLVGVAGTALTAGYAGWGPGRRASRDWLLHAKLHLIAGQASDLRVLRASYLSPQDAVRELNLLRERLAAAVGGADADTGSAQ